jgi:hypothetical protein
MGNSWWWDSFTTFLSNMWSGTSGKMAESIQEMAVAIVLDLENVTGMAGEDKRKEAYKRIEIKAKQEGIEVAGWVIESVIGMALLSIRK